MRTCPKCKKKLVAADGYCAGWCREIVMQPLSVKRGTDSQQRVVRLPRRVSTWLRKWKKNEDAKANAIRRQDFEAAAAYIKMKRSFADLICSELAKQPNIRS
jgi:hypothetical protein